jgi:hypothetical protein
MERNTITSLADLQPGDRFVYPKKTDDVWQIISKTKDFVSVNKFNAEGVKLFKHDELKKGTTQVRFLRHTTPVEHFVSGIPNNIK